MVRCPLCRRKFTAEPIPGMVGQVWIQCGAFTCRANRFIESGPVERAAALRLRRRIKDAFKDDFAR